MSESESSRNIKFEGFIELAVCCYACFLTAVAAIRMIDK